MDLASLVLKKSEYDITPTKVFQRGLSYSNIFHRLFHSLTQEIYPVKCETFRLSGYVTLESIKSSDEKLLLTKLQKKSLQKNSRH